MTAEQLASARSTPRRPAPGPVGAVDPPVLDHADCLDLLHHQTRVLELVAGGAPPAEVLTAVATALEELVPGCRCSILLLDPASATLHHGAAPSLPSAYLTTIDGMAIGPTAGSCGSAAFFDRPVVVVDVVADPRWAGFLAAATPHGLRACWSSPIRGRTGVLGTFAVYHDHPHEPDLRERLLVERFTHLSSVAIDHAELYGERFARREAEVARSAAEAASRAKTEFVSGLSHELRTPLQAITGFTELLATLDLPVERRHAALDHIATASAHILSLVDDTLDIARIEAGALRLRGEPVALAELASSVLDLLTPLADQRGVTLQRVGAEATAWVDRTRLRQVLINLVTNGIRYTPRAGWVEVSVEPGVEHVTVTVRDSGPGIPADRLERLFVPFDRLGAEGVGDGVGLGMALAKGLTEAMGGRLTVRSVVGRGTTVAVVLPARQAVTGRTTPIG